MVRTKRAGPISWRGVFGVLGILASLSLFPAYHEARAAHACLASGASVVRVLEDVSSTAVRLSACSTGTPVEYSLFSGATAVSGSVNFDVDAGSAGADVTLASSMTGTPTGCVSWVYSPVLVVSKLKSDYHTNGATFPINFLKYRTVGSPTWTDCGISLQVDNVNDAPVARGTASSIDGAAGGTGVDLSANATDVDTTTSGLAYAVDSLPRNGGRLYDASATEITSVPYRLPDSRVTFAPPSAAASDSFTWSVSDGSARSSSVALSFSINQAPRIASGHATRGVTAGNDGIVLVMTGFAVDSNASDTLTYQKSSLSSGSLSATATTSTWTYTPPATFAVGSVANLVWYATDSSGYPGHQTATGTVRIALNRAPVAANSSTQVTVGTSSRIELPVTDAEGNPVTRCELSTSTGTAWTSTLDAANTASIAVNGTGTGCVLTYSANATRRVGQDAVIYWRAGDAYGKSAVAGQARVVVAPGAVSTISLSVRIPYLRDLTANGTSGTVLEALAGDSYGNPVPNASVTLAIPANGGTTASANPGTTDRTGRASFAIVASTVAGSYVYGASSVGISGRTTLRFLPGGADSANSRVTVGSGSIDKGASTDLILAVYDAYGNALRTGGASVTFTQGGGTSSGSIGAVTDRGDGTYAATFTGTTAGTATTIGATVGGVSVTSSLPTITVASTQASLEVSLSSLGADVCGCSGSSCPNGVSAVSCSNLSFTSGTGYSVGATTGSNGCNSGNTNCRGGYIEFEFTSSEAETLGLAAGLDPVAIRLSGSDLDLNLLTQSELQSVASGSLSAEWEKSSTLSYTGNGAFRISSAAANYVQQDFPIVPNETYTVAFETDTSGLSNRALEVRMKYGSSESTFCYLAYPSGSSTTSASSFPTAGGAAGSAKYERVVLLPNSSASSGKFAYVYAAASNGTTAGDYASSVDVGIWTVLDQATSGLTFTRVETGSSGCTPTTSTPYSELVFVTNSSATGSFNLNQAKVYWNRDVETELYDGSTLIYRSPDSQFVPENLPSGSSSNFKVRVHLRSLARSSSPVLSGVSFLLAGESAVAKALALEAPQGDSANLAALGSADRLGTDVNWPPLSQKRNTTSTAQFTTNCIDYDVSASGYVEGGTTSCWQMQANNGLSRTRAYFPIDSWDLDSKSWATGSTKYFLPYLQQAVSILGSDPVVLLSIHGTGSNFWSGVTSSSSTSDGTNPSCTLANTATYRGCSAEANEQARGWCELNAMFTGCSSSSACTSSSTATDSIAKLVRNGISTTPIFEVFNEINIVDGSDRGSVADPYCSCDSSISSCAGEGALSSNYPGGSSTSLVNDGVTRLMERISGSLRSNGYLSTVSGLASEGNMIDSEFYSLLDGAVSSSNFDFINFHPYVDASPPEKVLDRWNSFYAAFASTWGSRRVVFGEYKVPRYTFDSSVSTNAYSLGFGELAQAKRLARQVIPMLVTPAESITYFYGGSNEDESYLGQSWDTQEAGGPATLWERSDLTTNPSMTSLMSGHTTDASFSIELAPLLGGKVLATLGQYLSRSRPLGYVADRTDASGDCVAANCETYFAAAFQADGAVVFALWFVPPHEFGGVNYVDGETSNIYYQNYYYGYDDGVDSAVHRNVGTNWDKSMRVGTDGVTYESVREVGFTGKRLHDFAVTLPASAGSPAGSAAGVAEVVDLETGRTRSVTYSIGSSAGQAVFQLNNVVVGEMPTLVRIDGVSF